jgi:hypothetical protein
VDVCLDCQVAAILADLGGLRLQDRLLGEQLRLLLLELGLLGQEGRLLALQ